MDRPILILNQTGGSRIVSIDFSTTNNTYPGIKKVLRISPGAQPFNPGPYASDLSTFLLLLAVYSLLKLFTGFARAALIAWKLIVNKVMISAIMPDRINTPGPILIR